VNFAGSNPALPTKNYNPKTTSSLDCFWILFFVQGFPLEDHLKNNPEYFPKINIENTKGNLDKIFNISSRLIVFGFCFCARFPL
jgi:hypothetical protein